MEILQPHLEALRRQPDGTFGRLALRTEVEKSGLPRHLVVSGPSGAGKGTVIEMVKPRLAESAGEIFMSRSFTTRAQRPGEADDAYVFVDHEEFERKVAAGEFLEWTQFHGNYYGTPMPPETGITMYEVEVNGFEEIKARCGSEARGIAVLPPSAERLWLQLIRRTDDSPDKSPAEILEMKLGRYHKFLDDELNRYRELGYHIVVNDNLGRAASAMEAAAHGVYWQCTDGEKYKAYAKQVREDGTHIIDLIERRAVDPFTLEAA